MVVLSSRSFRWRGEWSVVVFHSLTTEPRRGLGLSNYGYFVSDSLRKFCYRAFPGVSYWPWLT